MSKRLTTLLVAVIAVAGCTSSSHPKPTTTAAAAAAAADKNLAHITGVVWKDSDSSATVVYTDTTMRLFDGCSNQLAQLHVEHAALVEGGRIGKDGLCSGGISTNPQEGLSRFYAVVAGPASWSRAGDALTLTTPGKGSLTLTTNDEPAPMLVGTTWKLAGYTGTDTFERGASRHVDLVVHPNGSFTVGLACGSVNGTARVSPAGIRFIRVFPNRCAGRPKAADRVELAVFTASSVSYAIRGSELIIYGRGGRFLVYKIAADVATGSGFAGVEFGTSQPKAEHQLIELFGRPRHASQAQHLPAACGIDTTTAWADMTAYYFRHRFVGYLYQGSAPPEGLTVTTPWGLYIGEPLRDAEAAGGSAFKWSYAQGGSWTLRTPAGLIGGNLTEVPPRGNVENIAAGSLGCPAMVP